MKITIKTSEIQVEYEFNAVQSDKQLEFIKECVEKVSEETIKIKQA